MDTFSSSIDDFLLIASIITASACIGIALAMLMFSARAYRRVIALRRRRGISIVASNTAITRRALGGRVLEFHRRG